MGLDSEINELVEGSDLYEPKVITITTTTTTPYHTPYHTPSQPTLSPHPLNPPSYSHSPTPTQPTLLLSLSYSYSPHPLNPPSQPTLSFSYPPQVDLRQVVLPEGHLDALLAQCTAYDAFCQYRSAGLYGLKVTPLWLTHIYQPSLTSRALRA